MRRKFILLSTLLVTLFASSQDLILFRNGDRLRCKITKTDSLSVFYSIQKNGRNIDSFVDKNEIRSYQMNVSGDSLSQTISPKLKNENTKTVVLDSTVYVKNFSKWVNLITYSQKYGIHANGWSLQYSGYVLKNDSKWIIPVTFGLEDFVIDPAYFAQFNFQSAKINYYMVGISPLRKLNDTFYANIGFQFMLGSEELTDFQYRERKNTIVGIAPTQGILFIPKSNFGITAGLSVYEKLLTSQFYQNDLGVKLEIGLKF